MYNPNVPYRGPDPATRSLTEEITAKFGPPPRPYEFVTGWKDPSNVSGHNPDSNGITHGVDIFLAPERNRWVADHLAARGRAGDKRVGYVIYAGQIASPSTGYHFAGSVWEHWDHPHLSVCDGYWGGPCAMYPSIYNDTSNWGIANTASPLSTDKPQPIQEDDMPLNAEDKKFIQDEIERRHVVTRDVIRAHGFSDENKLFIQTAVETRAVVTRDVIKSAVGTLAQFTPGIDSDKLEAAMQDAVAKAVKEGLANGINVDVTVGGTK